MLDLAYKYEKELKELFMNTWYDEKYMFYHYGIHHEIYANDKNDWNSRQFVSLDSTGKVIGYISYEINRTSDFANGFGAINFSDNKAVFGKDLVQVIDDIFCKFNMRKLQFCVVCGNPIEKNYDKLIKQYNGRIIGIRKQQVKLLDNKYYDDKMYEIFREDYINTKRPKFKKYDKPIIIPTATHIKIGDKDLLKSLFEMEECFNEK